MKKTFKKLTALLLGLTMLFSYISVSAGVDYSVEDAYNECAEIYPDFVARLKAQGVSDTQIINFLKTVQEYLLNLEEPVTEENFDDHIIDAILFGFSQVKHIRLRNAMMQAFPEAVVDGSEGEIHPDFIPVLETVKKIIFDNGMLNSDPVDDKKEETKPTEATTEEKTEPTEKETTTEKEKPTSSGNTGGPTGGPTDTPTEAPTEAPTEKNTDEPDSEDTEATQPTQSAQPTEPVFLDMAQAAWAEEAVVSLVKSQIISGYPDGTFKPNNAITRAEFAKIIVLASGRYNKNAKCAFEDVKEGDWYYSYVACAKELGFIAGRSDTVFDPLSNITRADICTIVYRFIKSVNSEFKPKNAPTVFSDGDKIPSYAKEAVNALNGEGIIGGVGNNLFDPSSPATRAQSAKIIYGALNAAFGF